MQRDRARRFGTDRLAPTDRADAAPARPGPVEPSARACPRRRRRARPPQRRPRRHRVSSPPEGEGAVGPDRSGRRLPAVAEGQVLILRPVAMERTVGLDHETAPHRHRSPAQPVQRRPPEQGEPRRRMPAERLAVRETATRSVPRATIATRPAAASNAQPPRQVRHDNRQDGRGAGVASRCLHNRDDEAQNEPATRTTASRIIDSGSSGAT